MRSMSVFWAPVRVSDDARSLTASPAAQDSVARAAHALRRQRSCVRCSRKRRVARAVHVSRFLRMTEQRGPVGGAGQCAMADGWQLPRQRNREACSWVPPQHRELSQRDDDHHNATPHQRRDDSVLALVWIATIRREPRLARHFFPLGAGAPATAIRVCSCARTPGNCDRACCCTLVASCRCRAAR